MGRIAVKCVRVKMEQNVPMLTEAVFVIKDGRERIVRIECVHLDFMVNHVKILVNAMRIILKCKYLYITKKSISFPSK